MLRVGLTGELGSGKSTVARLLAAHGAEVLSSDEMGRAMMQPGEPVYQAIVDHFGATILQPDGLLDRLELARLAFDAEHPRVEELNAIVHPAVIAEQQRRLQAIGNRDPRAIVVVESALILTTRHAGTGEPWRDRFDNIVLVTAPDEVKVQRFIQRASGGKTLTEAEAAVLRLDAQRRLAAQQVSDAPRSAFLVLNNDGDLEELGRAVARLWDRLRMLEQEHAGQG